MNALWLLKDYYRHLREAVDGSTHEFSYRHLAADLRGLLIDAEPIADAANRMFRLRVVFPVLQGVTDAEFAPRPDGAALNELLLAGPPAMSRSRGSRVKQISRDDFLALPAVRLTSGEHFSLCDVVLAGAHLAGGVHSAPRGAGGNRLRPLAAALFGPKLSSGSELLVAVARHVLAAYEHLFTLAEGASLGLAQRRREHQPLLQRDPTRGKDGIAMEFSGREFFEDGLPAGFRSPMVWVGTLALQLPNESVSRPRSPYSDRHIVEIGPVDQPGPRFAVIQRGRSILARFVAYGGEKITTPPLRLMNRRFYAVAAGVTERGSKGPVRIFVRLRGAPRHAEALGPRGIGIGASRPSRVTVGAGLDSSEARSGHGAVMQLREQVLMEAASEHDIDAVLEHLWGSLLSRRWVVNLAPELRISMIYNQTREAPRK